MTDTNSLVIELSTHAAELLDCLVSIGLYGQSRAGVAERLIEERLREFVAKPSLKYAAIRVTEKHGPKKKKGSRQ